MNTILAIKSNSRETVDRLFDAKRLLSERPSHTLPAKVVKEHIYIYIYSFALRNENHVEEPKNKKTSLCTAHSKELKTGNLNTFSWYTLVAF